MNGSDAVPVVPMAYWSPSVRFAPSRQTLSKAVDRCRTRMRGMFDILVIFRRVPSPGRPSESEIKGDSGLESKPERCVTLVSRPAVRVPQKVE